MGKQLSSVRYFMFSLGFFACFVGLLYNEFFSFPLDLFGSCYGAEPEYLNPQYNTDNETLSGWGYMRESLECTYPFGMDPVWKLSELDIQMFNGVKMKISVILGVFLMELGICCKMVNAAYRNKGVEMCEAVAMFLMLFLLFGFMDILIFVKWLIPMDIQDGPILESDGTLTITDMQHKINSMP